MPLLGVVAAFGIAPGTTTEKVPLHTVLEDVDLTPETIENSFQPDQKFYREERVQRGDTFGSVLSRLGITDPVVAPEVLRQAQGAGISQLRAGRTLKATVQKDGTLLGLRYLAPDGSETIVRRTDTGRIELANRMAPLTVRLSMTSGRIRTSLFQATDEAGLDDEVAAQLAEVFSGEVDFHRDLQAGDRFSVVYETMYSGSEFVRSGRLLAAEFQNGSKFIRALYFQDSEQGYFTENGGSLKKSFLRSPIEFSRISSGFSASRFHPVLETWRAHRGVDYAAPIGTRVRATADGLIKTVGSMRGYGNVVVIRHPNGYETLYAHLSAFGSGIRPGARVSQGAVIGFVGMTGLATGPHLHYELRVDGEHRDPLKVVVPQAQGLSGDRLYTFKETVEPLVNRLEMMSGIDVSMN